MLHTVNQNTKIKDANMLWKAAESAAMMEPFHTCCHLMHGNNRNIDLCHIKRVISTTFIPVNVL